LSLKNPNPNGGRVGYGNPDFFVQVHGIIDLELQGQNTQSLTFDNHHAFVFIRGNIHQTVFINLEVEYEHSGTKVELDLAELRWKIYKEHLNLRVGRVIAPFGIARRLRYPSLQRYSVRQITNDQIVPGSWYANGLGLMGTLGTDDFQFVYETFLCNGLGDQAATNVRNARPYVTNGARDNNIDKSFVGRLAFRYKNLFEVGGSYSTGAYRDQDCQETGCLDQRLHYIGADARFTYKQFDVRSEFIWNSVDVYNAQGNPDTLIRWGAYVEIAYKWQPLKSNRFLNSLQPSIRIEYADLDIAKDDTNDVLRLSLSFGYSPIPYFLIRFEYHYDIEVKVDSVSNNRYVVAFIGVF
jgi:hypothetical protein